jgi:mRNA-degrading endonuclease RelE of RelBE toxin-antitoxin system
LIWYRLLAIHIQVDIRYYVSSNRTNPTLDFIDALPPEIRAQIKGDIAEVGERPHDPSVVWRWITGHSPMREIKTGGYRTFFFIEAEFIWVLNCAKKEAQEHAIRVAADRMKSLRREIAEYVQALKKREAEKRKNERATKKKGMR